MHVTSTGHAEHASLLARFAFFRICSFHNTNETLDNGLFRFVDFSSHVHIMIP